MREMVLRLQSGPLARTLFPAVPRQALWARWINVALRSVHIAAMAVMLGATPYVHDRRALRVAICLTVFSGLGLWALDLYRSAAVMFEGSGLALLLKLGCLAVGMHLASDRYPWYLAAAVVASVGSHMPRTWRHRSFLPRRLTDG
ncbi:MAG: hypothetical protein HY823_13450 [Acidobacteria bacterium]|nr:hypothetical protein [Acidobacteriota bacterium]